MYLDVPRTEPFAVRLRRLREKAGLSRSQLSRKTATMGGGGLPEITIKVLETDHGRQPVTNTVEILAAALEVTPEEFPEYMLAQTRRLLDERPPPLGVGLDQALANLEASGLATRAAEAAAARSGLPDMPVTRPGALPDPERSAPTRKPRRTAQGTKGDRSPSRRRDVA